MFGLKRKKRSYKMLNQNFVLNREKNPRQHFETPKNTQFELQKHLEKIPVTDFSTETSGVPILEPKFEPIIETTNSKVVNEIAKGCYTCPNLPKDDTLVPLPKQHHAIDKQVIITKDPNIGINPETKQNIITGGFKNSKKAKKIKTVFDLHVN